MNIDPNGEFFFSLLASIGIGMLIGGIAGAISAAIAGEDVVAGLVSGAVSGAIITVGIGLALAAGPGGIVVAAAAGFLGGFAGDSINQGMSDGWDGYNLNHALAVGGITAVFSVATFGLMSFVYSNSVGASEKIVDTALKFTERAVASLGLSAETVFMAFTVGAGLTLASNLANLLFPKEDAIVIDAIAGCDGKA